MDRFLDVLEWVIYGALTSWHLFVAFRVKDFVMLGSWAFVYLVGTVCLIFRPLLFLRSVLAWGLVLGLWLWRRRFFYSWQRFRKLPKRSAF